MKKIIHKLYSHFQSFISFLNGFRKIDYVVPLRDGPFLSEEMKQNIQKKSDQIIKKMNLFDGIKIVEFGIPSYKIEKTEERMPVLYAILNKAISFTKASSERFVASGKTEIRLKHILYVEGMDKNVWKIFVDSYLLFYSDSCFYERQLIDLCTEIINYFLEEIKIQKVMNGEIHLNYTWEYQSYNARTFNGVVRTYGDELSIESNSILSVFEEEENEAVLYEKILLGNMKREIDNTILKVVHNNNEQPV